MASNILSRLLPSGSDDEAPAAQQPYVDDVEAQAADDLASEPQFEDQDLEQLLAEGMEDDIRTRRNSQASEARSATQKRSTRIRLPPPPSATNARGQAIDDDDDDDVPESLLLEERPERRRKRPSKPTQASVRMSPPLPGPASRTTRLQWEVTQAEQPIHSQHHRPRHTVLSRPSRTTQQSTFVNRKEQAKWMWASVNNLDNFLERVYSYYVSHGFWSILLARVIYILTALFVYGLSTFLFFCIDYSKLPGSSRLEQVQIPKCTINLPWYWNLLTFTFILYEAYETFKFVSELPECWNMLNFYHYLLEIPDKDIQNVSWQDIIAKLMTLRDLNPNTASNLTPAQRKYVLGSQSKQRMDAHDIANRLMRRENFWIAMINKDILDCSLQLPFLGKRSFYTTSLETGMRSCIENLIFDVTGQVRMEYRSTRNRAEAVRKLQSRFLAAAVITMFLSLPIALYAIAVRFLGSFTEYQKNPAELSTRKFSILAEWKIRDFNELPHLFEQRKRMAYPFANRYLDQFPKDKLSRLMTFAAFIVGSLAAVLGVITLWDPDLFLGFEIAGKTALFWLGIFGTLFVTFRNAAADDEMDLWDPEFAMNAVIAQTHYCPESWKNRLYSEEVRKDFSSMYKLEVLLFLEEVVGIIMTPLMLCWVVPNCAERVVDFFREFTVHVDGLGTVCSYAVFDFRNGGKAAGRPGQGPGDLREGYYGDKANKLMESYMSFIDHYGPNPKRGLPSRKRAFHPPPTFPGIMGGPTMVHDAASQRNHASVLRHSVQHTPSLRPAVSNEEPMHSILLDPHHQPRMSSHQQQQHHTRGSKMGPTSSRHHVLDDNPRETDEERGEDNFDHQRPEFTRTTSKLLEEDSQLEESWIFKADDDRAGAEAASSEPKVGVLGLLSEFTRPKTDTRGGRI